MLTSVNVGSESGTNMNTVSNSPKHSMIIFLFTENIDHNIRMTEAFEQKLRLLILWFELVFEAESGEGFRLR